MKILDTDFTHVQTSINLELNLAYMPKVFLKCLFLSFN